MRLKIPLLILLAALLGGCYTVVLTPDEADLYDSDPYGLLPEAAGGSSLGSSAPYWDPWWEPHNPYARSGYTSYFDPGYYYYSYNPYSSSSYYTPVYYPIGPSRKLEAQTARGTSRGSGRSRAPDLDRKDGFPPTALPTMPPITSPTNPVRPAEDKDSSGASASSSSNKTKVVMAPADPPADNSRKVTKPKSEPKKSSDQKKSRSSRTQSRRR